jgi:hypothetical protein
MERKYPKIPYKEISRYYGRQRDLSVNDMLVKGDFEDDDFEIMSYK